MEDFKKDIVMPYYPHHDSKPIIYPFFMMDCKDIENVILYKQDITHFMLRIVQKVQSPMCDFGLLYDCPVRLKWIFVENGLELYKEFKVKYMGYYLNEDTMTLEDLEMVVHDIFIIKEMQSVIEKKSKIVDKYIHIPTNISSKISK
jgi:hypothetical protein